MANFELNVKINGIEQSVSTIGALEQALAATNAQLVTVEKNSKEFGFLTNQASNLETVLSAVSTDAQTLSSNLNSVNQSASQLNNTFTETANAASRLGDNKATENLRQDIGETATKATSLRTELRKITMELQNLEPGTQRFQELSLRAGELRDQIGDTQAVVGALAGSVGERLGRALGSTIQIGVAGFQAIQGAAALFGVEAEALEPTLVRLTALLNLSQALETFGGLPDKINEIRAGFTSVLPAIQEFNTATEASAIATGLETTAEGAAATATTAAAAANSANAISNQADAAASLEDAAAKGVEAAATNTATVATTGLGLAMKALPIVAIVAALGTLVYGIYQYVNANDEAKKAEDKRKKAIEEQMAAQKKLRDERDNSIKGTVQETITLEKMLFQLRATNKGSEERVKLIKEINESSGMNIKNIQDEAKFQEQLNNRIVDYIAYQRIKVLQDMNEAKFTAAVTEQQIALDKIKNLNISNYLKEQVEMVATGKLKGSEIKYTKDLILVERDFSGMSEKKQKIMKNLVFTFDDYLAVITQSNYKLKELGGTSAALSQQLEDIRKSLGLKDEIKTVTTVTKLKKDETALAQFKNDLLKETAKLNLDEQLAATKKTASLIDDLKLEQQIAKDTLDERLKAALKADKDEVDSKKKSKTEKDKINNEYDAALVALDERFKARLLAQGALETTERQKIIDSLLNQNEILQTEIRFGDQSTLDNFAAIGLRKTQTDLEQIEKRLMNEEMSQAEYEVLLNKRKDKVEEIAKVQALNEIQIAKNARDKQLQDYAQLLETQTGIKIGQVNSETKLDEKLAEAQTKLANAKTDEEFQTAQIQIGVYENLKKTQENLAVEFAQTEVEINAKKDNTISDATIKSQEETFAKQLQLLNNYFDIASQAIDQFSVQSLGGYNTAISSSLNLVSDLLRLSEESFETTSDKIVAYAQVIGQTLNAVFSAFIEQNQAALDADLEAFRIDSDERQRILTDQLNNGLITRAQYDAAVENLDKDLYAKQQKIKKDAFEQDKKLRIAQATIAGLQGAVAAFAGAMQLGPIAGPIVGGILAAAVAALTAANISTIQKQKFDGGPGRIDAGAGATPTAAAQINQSSTGGFTSFNENVTGGQTTGQTTTPTGTTQMQKVYVLESDISSAQDRVRVLENNSTFG